MAHSAERLNTSAALLSGGRVCPYGGGIENLLSALPLVQPTSLNAPPRFWNFLRSEFMTTVEQMLEADRGMTVWWSFIVIRAFQSWTMTTRSKLLGRRLWPSLVAN